MYFLFFSFFLRLWNMSFITSRGSSSRVLHYQSKIHTERCCEFQEIKQSMVGCGSGWFLSGCLWVSPTSHLAVGGTNASNGVLLGWRGVAERLVCHCNNIPSADLSLPCGCKTSRTCSPTLSPAHSYAFSQWASWKQNKSGGGVGGPYLLFPDVLEPPAPPSILSAISDVSNFSEPSPFSDLSFSDLSSPSTSSDLSDLASASPSDLSFLSERSGSMDEVPGLSHLAMDSCSAMQVVMFEVQALRSS